MTKASTDQDHIEIIIYNKTSIPDRTSYILGKSKDSPVLSMIETGQALEELSVDYIAIPCITAHYFYDELTSNIKTPIINAVSKTALYLKEYGVSTVGILATEGTLASNLFQNKLREYGISTVIPGALEQEYVNHIIYNDIKANKTVDIDKFNLVANDLRKRGSEIIILACSELSIIKGNHDIGEDFIDTMEVLARSCIINCNGKLKEDYKYLIKKWFEVYYEQMW